MMMFRSRPFLAIALLLLALPAAAAAQSSSQEFGWEGQYHWGFAAFMGSGDYQQDGSGVMYLFSVQPAFTLRKFDGLPGSTRQGLVQLKIPVFVGLENWTTSDLLKGRLIRNISLFGIAPRIEMEFPAGPRLSFRGYVQAGLGNQFQGVNETVGIFALGVKARSSLSLGASDLFVLDGFDWYIHTSPLSGPEGLFTLRNGAEWAVPLWTIKAWKEPLLLRLHVINTWTVSQVSFFRAPEFAPASLGARWEIGLALGRKTPFRLWIFDFDRIGLAYMTGPQRSGLRFYFSSWFVR